MTLLNFYAPNDPPKRRVMLPYSLNKPPDRRGFYIYTVQEQFSPPNKHLKLFTYKPCYYYVRRPVFLAFWLHTILVPLKTNYTNDVELFSCPLIV